MKKKKSIEMQIYEFLGIKQFRKLAIFLLKCLCWPIFKFFNLTKEEQTEFLSYAPNYFMKKGNGIQDLKDFKKYLLFNAIIHALLIIAFKDWFIFFKSLSLGTKIALIVNIIINSYCIMLQRYNQLKINRAIARLQPIYEKKESKLKEDIKNKELYLDDYNYKYCYILKKEKEITFEEFLKTASFQELKNYRNILLKEKQYQKLHEMVYDKPLEREEIIINLPKNKKLVLERKK